MDELNLVIEGIRIKLKKLLIRTGRLQGRVGELEKENKRLQDDLRTSSDRIEELEKDLAHTQAARLIGMEDTDRAKQKIDELLREIEKTNMLLKR